MSLPRARSGLLRHALENQVLVYDPRDERVHLLDVTTAFVLELLDEGGWSVDTMTKEIARRHNVEADPAFVLLALEELRKAGLLEHGFDVPAPLVDVTRRDLVRKLALTGAAAFLVPAVATLTPTRGYAQGSLPGQTGSSCTSSTECNSGFCCGGLCSATACGTLAACTPCQTGQQCQSGECPGGRNCAGGTGNDPDKTENGGACTGNGGCCSNNCVNNVCTANTL